MSPGVAAFVRVGLALLLRCAALPDSHPRVSEAEPLTAIATAPGDPPLAGSSDDSTLREVQRHVGAEHSLEVQAKGFVKRSISSAAEELAQNQKPSSAPLVRKESRQQPPASPSASARTIDYSFGESPLDLLVAAAMGATVPASHEEGARFSSGSRSAAEAGEASLIKEQQLPGKFALPNTTTKSPTTTTTKIMRVDHNTTLPLDSVLVYLSRKFVREQVSAERLKNCPANKEDWNFTVLQADVQQSDRLVVTLHIRFAASNETIHGVQVMWMSDSKDISLDASRALARVEAGLVADGGFAGMMGAGAKLVLPMDACEFGKVHRKSSANLAEQEGEPDGDLDEDALWDMAHQPTRAFGVIVEEELRAYKQGLETQASLTEQSHGRDYATGPLPATWKWKDQFPQCLDYVNDQGSCGCCYMFAALNTLSDRHCINKQGLSTLGSVDHLSVQRPLLCEPLGRQCSGGWADVAFNYTLYSLDDTEAHWSYEPTCLSQAPCAFGKQCITRDTAAHDKCSNFFTRQLKHIDTFDDAFEQVREMCKPLLLKDACIVWAKATFLRNRTSVAFMPSPKFCKALEKNFTLFKQGTVPSFLQEDFGDASLLEEEEYEEGEAGFGRSKRFWPFDGWSWSWGSKRSEDPSSPNQWGSGGTTTTTTGNPSAFGFTVGDKVTWTGADDDVPAGSVGTVQSFTATQVAVKFNNGTWLFAPGDLRPYQNTAAHDRLCDRSRCASEQPLAVHTLTSYVYVTNTKDQFQLELYNGGPMYTSFYVYEDFTWFFQMWPTWGYNRQWGAQLGGHAVSLVGWESNCIYPDDTSQLTPVQSNLLQQQSASQATGASEDASGSGEYEEVRRVLLGSRGRRSDSRRRTSTGTCWHLRNTWGPDWADNGYFRMKDDMLTGPDGVSLHIATAAGIGPVSTNKKGSSIFGSLGQMAEHRAQEQHDGWREHFQAPPEVR